MIEGYCSWQVKITPYRKTFYSALPIKISVFEELHLILGLSLAAITLASSVASFSFIHWLFDPSVFLQEQQKQAVSGEEEAKDSETPVHETDSQYGTWETGLRTDDR